MSFPQGHVCLVATSAIHTELGHPGVQSVVAMEYQLSPHYEIYLVKVWLRSIPIILLRSLSQLLL